MSWQTVPICDECWEDEEGDRSPVRAVCMPFEPCYRCRTDANIFVRRDMHPAWTPHEMPTAKCPHCATESTHATSPEPHQRPKPGDITVCIECGGLGVFTDEGIRVPTPIEYDSALADASVLRLVTSIAAVHEQET